MKVYLAGCYGRREELAGYAERLDAEGIDVTSHWLSGEHENDSLTGVNLDGSVDECATWALDDLADVREADVLMLFTEPAELGSQRGGRHVEYGYALGRDKLLVIVGRRENIFHCFSSVPQFDDFDAALDFLTDLAMGFDDDLA